MTIDNNTERGHVELLAIMMVAWCLCTGILRVHVLACLYESEWCSLSSFPGHACPGNEANWWSCMYWHQFHHHYLERGSLCTCTCVVAPLRRKVENGDQSAESWFISVTTGSPGSPGAVIVVSHGSSDGRVHSRREANRDNSAAGVYCEADMAHWRFSAY